MVRSMYSGVAGLRAHQTRMDVIGNNIANCNTYGYKSSRATFRDVYYQTLSGASAGSQLNGGTNPTQVGYGVQMSTIDVMHEQSGFQSTDRGLDLAIAGEGYFQVMASDGTVYYTRNGNFTIDAFGNLTDSNGSFVLGISGEEALSQPGSSNKIQIVVPPIQDNQASDTKSVKFAGIPAQDITIKAIGAGESGNVTINFVKGVEGEGSFATFDGSQVTVTLDPTEEFSTVDDINKLLTVAAGTPGEKAPDGTVGILDPDGNYLFPDDLPQGFKIEALTFPQRDTGNTNPDGTPILEDMPLTGEDIAAKFGTFKTEEGRSFALQSVKDLKQVAIGKNGIIEGIHAIHGRLVLGRVDIATFNNPQGLSQAGNSYFTETSNSGKAQATRPGDDGAGEIKSGALEMSNVDLSKEFTDMIVTQRGFQANSRIITVADEMLQELVNLKR